MTDHATSTDSAVQAQLDRLWALSPGADILGLGRITRLLARLGDPHLRLPPVFHVAGTNGKGSTCAFLRAALEAAGHAVHVYSSPHLVRFNERIRLAGRLIDDAALAGLLAEVLDQADGIGASFFEVTTAAAFLAFARVPAAATIVEVGLGGRLDATNVVQPLVTGIAALGIDHQAFLGDTLDQIAGEKAGIAKPGIPLVTMDYPPAIAARIAAVADTAAAPLFARGTDWSSQTTAQGVRYDQPGHILNAPLPTLGGQFQAENYALAIAMLRHQHALSVPDSAIREAATRATWPARLQRLRPGPLVDRLAGRRVFLDGAHNVSAARQVARSLPARDMALVLGMLANKDAEGVLAALVAGGAITCVIGVPVPGHASHPPEALAAIAHANGIAAAAADSLTIALDALADQRHEDVLIAGSLYLAGLALDANDEAPA
jgi:dihydrofolate synthase/folylpolyglutamate synthase